MLKRNHYHESLNILFQCVTMKITAFNGSPRGERSNTHTMVESLFAGAAKAGAEVEEIYLTDKNIASCKGCFTCWLKTPGTCIIQDDMQNLQHSFISSDIVVLASPLYVDNVSGLLKTFMDRLIPIVDPHIEEDENGECRHVKRYKKYPKLVILSNSGFPEQSHFQVLHLYFERVARNVHSEVVAEIYLPGGEILRVDMLIVKPFITSYKKLLQKAGMELVQQQLLSEEIQKKLQKPIVPPKQYIKGLNKRFDQVLS